MNAQLDIPEPTGQIIPDEPAAHYYRRVLGEASNSALKLLRERSPAHYHAWVHEPDADVDTPALAFGRAYHCRVLEPARFAEQYQVTPDFGPLQSSRNRAARDEWLAAHPGVTLLARDVMEQIEAMHAALMQHKVAAALMKSGLSEVTMRWTDRETGLPCKARADWWIPDRGVLMDLKTTEDASPDAFRRAVVQHSYHVQHAHYVDGAAECGETAKHFLIVAQEKRKPYPVAVYHIDSFAEARGYELRQRSMETLRQCMETDTWPAYGAGITELTLPAWALKD